MKTKLFTIMFFICSLSYAGNLKVIKTDKLINVRNGNIPLKSYIIVDQGIIQKILSFYEFSKVKSDFLNAEFIDLTGHYVLPGLVDLHSHLSLSFGTNKIDDSIEVLLKRAQENSHKTLLAGFTTVRIPGEVNIHGDVSIGQKLRKSIRSSKAIGPRIFHSGHALTMKEGHCDPVMVFRGDRTNYSLSYKHGLLEDDANINNEAIKAVEHQKSLGADWVKVCTTAGVISMEEEVGSQQIPTDTLKVIVDKAHKLGLKVASHAHGTKGIRASLQANVDTVEHASMLTESEIKVFKSQNKALIPTIYMTDGAIDVNKLPPLLKKKALKVFKLHQASFKNAVTNDLKIAFGTDAGVYPHGNNAKEFTTMVKLGLTPLKAIQSATIVASEVLGDSKIGMISEGSYADIIAVKANPLKDISTLESPVFVMKNGVVYKNAKTQN